MRGRGNTKDTEDTKATKDNKEKRNFSGSLFSFVSLASSVLSTR